ncbi:hypothetical protein C8R44DRAFT_865568 [Mycena epipterygia]|nr:hypothetical protein C8R44DRAFT_865568 [Mycena epipterygia]
MVSVGYESVGVVVYLRRHLTADVIWLLNQDSSRAADSAPSSACTPTPHHSLSLSLHRPQHAPPRRITRSAFLRPRPERPPSLQPLRRPSSTSSRATITRARPTLALLSLLAVLKWLPPRLTAPRACELCECVGEYDVALDTDPSLWLGDSGGLPLVWLLGLWGFAATNKGGGSDASEGKSRMGSNPARYVHHTCAYKCAWKRAGHAPASSSPLLALALVEWEWDLEVQCKYACCAWAPLVLEAQPGKRTPRSQISCALRFGAVSPSSR